MLAERRLYGLDILRAVAILLSIVFHTNKLLRGHIDVGYFRALPDGLALFFALSGFLIGTILLKLASRPAFTSRDLVHFWSRRWLRTLPVYFTILLALIAHRAAMGSFDINAYYKHFFFIQNITTADFYFFRESWSLSVEEWFYLIIPLGIYTSIKITNASRKTIVLAWIIAIIVIVTIIRAVTAQHVSTYEEWNHLMRKPVIARLDGLMFGFLAAFLHFYKCSCWNQRSTFFLVGMLLLLICPVTELVIGFRPLIGQLRLTLESIGAMMLLPYLVNVKTGRGPVYRLLTWISIVSYSLYLVNYTPFNEWILPRLERIGVPAGHSLALDLTKTFINLVWTFGAGWLLHTIIEKPFMRMRNDDKTSSVASGRKEPDTNKIV